MLGGFSYLLPSSMASIVWALLSVRSAHLSQLLQVPPGDSLVHIWSLKRLSTLPSVGSQTGLSDPIVYTESVVTSFGWVLAGGTPLRSPSPVPRPSVL